MHLLSLTLNLIAGSQRDRYPEEECMGVWLSLRILDSWYVSVLFRTLQRLVIHLVARVLNRSFWFSKNTRIAQNTTSITKVRALNTKSSNITLVNTSKLL